MKKFFILMAGILVLSATSICNASWWYDFIHSDGGDGAGTIPCYACGGSGSCSACSGLGYEEAYDYENERPYSVPCSNCGGSGTCSSCYGSGHQ